MINIHCYNINLLKILYPGYKISDKEQFIAKQIIYTGNKPVVGDHEVIYYHSYMNKNVEIKLHDCKSVVCHAYKRKKVKIVPKSIIRHIEKLPVDRLEQELRLFMAVGKWSKGLTTDVKVYKLFDVLGQSKKQVLSVYFALRRQHHVYELWGSILTFLIRVKNFKDDGAIVSDYYKEIIKSFQNRSSKLSSIVNLLYKNHFNEIVILNTLLKVR